jgi:predicted branched-subunit amino acid permease
LWYSSQSLNSLSIWGLQTSAGAFFYSSPSNLDISVFFIIRLIFCNSDRWILQ